MPSACLGQSEFLVGFAESPTSPLALAASHCGRGSTRTGTRPLSLPGSGAQEEQPVPALAPGGRCTGRPSLAPASGAGRAGELGGEPPRTHQRRRSGSAPAPLPAAAPAPRGPAPPPPPGRTTFLDSGRCLRGRPLGGAHTVARASSPGPSAARPRARTLGAAAAAAAAAADPPGALDRLPGPGRAPSLADLRRRSAARCAGRPRSVRRSGSRWPGPPGAGPRARRRAARARRRPANGTRSRAGARSRAVGHPGYQRGCAGSAGRRAAAPLCWAPGARRAAVGPARPSRLRPWARQPGSVLGPPQAESPRGPGPGPGPLAAGQPGRTGAHTPQRQ